MSFRGRRNGAPGPALLAVLLASACGEDSAESAAGAECCEEELAATPLPDTSIYLLESEWQDQNAVVRPLSNSRGTVQIAAMIFTNCSYACPRTLADLRAVDAAIPPAQRDRVHFLLMSFDDERDQPEVLKAYAEREGLDPARWTLLHGESDAVREVAAVLGISYRKTETGDFAHSNVLTVLDRDGNIAHQERGLGADLAVTAAAVAELLQ